MMNILKTPLLFLSLALTVGACAGATEKSSPDEVKAFFAAANEANFLGVTCLSSQNVDLSAYSSQMGVKYPPTHTVDVLSEAPSRPYQGFAVLQVAAAPASSAAGTVDPAVLAQLTAKAKEIGADAIIICRTPSGPAQAGADRPIKIEAVAIKYRRENPQGK